MECDLFRRRAATREELGSPSVQGCPLARTETGLDRRSYDRMLESQPPRVLEHARVGDRIPHDRIAIAREAPSVRISRGFLPWRLSDDGPGASLIVATGRHPKPFTGAAIAPP
jgi:hypothetical protein